MGGSFGLGSYQLFQYGGTLTDNGLTVASLPPSGYTGLVQTAINGQVNLLVLSSASTLVQYWDGADYVGGAPGGIDGGSGTWSLGVTETNWTGAAPSQINSDWQQGSVAVFTTVGGTVTLTDTIIAEGLQFAVDGYLLTGGELDVAANTWVSTALGTTATIDSLISGAGVLTKQGDGTLVLNAANTYSAGTDIQDGTVVVGNNLALGTGDVTLGDNTTLAAGVSGLVLTNAITTVGNGIVDSGAGDFTLAGVIDGAGSISQVGTGNLILNGNNSFTNLGINQGTVTVGTNTAAGIGGITINNNATLAAGVDGLVLANGIQTTANGIVDNAGFTFTLDGNIGGAGSISSVGLGNLVLNGDNSFVNLGINQGTVTVGTNTAAGIGGISIDNNTTLAAGVDGLVLANGIVTTANGIVDNGGFTFTLNGNIGGAGSISSVGTGNLVLNGDNSFVNLGINQGTVTVGTNTAAGSGGITINDNATLAAGVDGLVLANGIETTANGIVDNGGFTFTLDGNIGGAGSISSIGLGNLVLNGDNSFTNLGINQGTVTVGTNTAAGIGGITINDNATLAAGVDGLVLANGIETTANGIVDNGGFTFTLNGNIGGAGSISSVGLGNLVLNGNNTFTNLGINQGTVTVGTNTAAGAGGITINNNATLAAGVDGLVLANGIETTANGIVDNGGFTFTLNGNIGGAGSISSVGTGNLVLNGNNTFTNLGINQGTVTVGTNTAAGIGGITINNNATLAAGVDGLVLANGIETTGNGIVDNAGFTFTLNGNIGGAGSISSVGTGNLVLNGNNSFINLGINQGTVTVGTNTAAGAGGISMNDNTTLAAGVSGLVLANGIVTTGNGMVNSGPGVFTLNGDISGAGSISQIGTGNLVLNGNNSFVNLGINQGTVTVGTDTAAGSGGITINNNATLAAGVSGLVLANGIETTGNGIVNSGPGIFTLDGNIGGAGSISQVGTGNLVLNGDNSFTNLGINQGTVTVGSDTAAGIGGITINNNATLANNKDVTLANGIVTTGNGIVDVVAGTTMVLNGNIAAGGLGANLVTNGSFETGSISGWTNTGAGFDWAALTSLGPVDGLYYAGTGCVGTPCPMSQTIATTPGQSYLLSYAFNPGPGAPSVAYAVWDGTTVLNMPAGPAVWTNYSTSVVATGGSSLLQFFGQQIRRTTVSTLCPCSSRAPSARSRRSASAIWC